MKRFCVLIISVWLGLGSGSAQAQFSWNPFRKASPPPPKAERVGQLVNIVKGDADERKRTLAVEELREFDPKAFPEIVPILADVAQSDPKAGVRAEAVSSLVRIRPVTAIAGQAIEFAAAKDENWRNRMSAQAALVRYRLAGYSPNAAVRNDMKPPSLGPNLPNQSPEPPLGDRPPVIYHDQFGKVIPAPKNLPGNVAPVSNPVIGTPTSNPGGKMKLPFFPIGPSNSPSVPTPTVPSQPPQTKVPAPVSVEPVFRNLNRLPPVPEPGPLVLTPPPQSAPIPNITPAVPAPNPAAPTLLGPSLDLPPLPVIPAPAPNPAPAPAAPSGPASDVPNTSVSPLPSGRMEPSPRLSPVAVGPTP